MGIINFIMNFFEESEEELLEDIKEAERIKRESEKRLKELRKKKTKPIDKKVIRKWSIIIGIIILIIIGWYGIKFYKSIPKPFRYKCEELNPCEDCLVTASCIMFEEAYDEHFVHFTITNQIHSKNTIN